MKAAADRKSSFGTDTRGEGAPVRAVQYVRMSTDRQQYSTRNQSEANHDYAALHGMIIVRTYADEGKSGLTVRGRAALKRLIGDIEAGRADFAAVLVYDVSRWGRFQDADEGSYYEHICKRAGIQVHYCAEPFRNNGDVYAAIVKTIKRAMAAEYSRELSVKAFAGQQFLARLGFRMGAPPPYGTRRRLVDSSGAAKGVLDRGQRKSLQVDRVILMPGPPEEIAVVRRIFSTFVTKQKSEGVIARELNEEGIASGLPRPWTPARIRWLLRNEIYLGNVVWNRTSARLRGRARPNHPDAWVRRPWPFPPIVERAQFDAAQAIFRQRRAPFPKEEVLEALRRVARTHGFLDQRLIEASPGLPSVRRLYDEFGGVGKIRELIGAKGRLEPSDDELLAALRRLLRKKGHLTKLLVNASKAAPHASVYERRFGSLSAAYRLIGYENGRGSRLSDDEALEALREVLRKHGRLSTRLIERSKGTPSVFIYRTRFGSLVQAYELISYRGDYWNQQTRPSPKTARETSSE